MGFIFARRSALMKLSVAGVAGSSSSTKSDCASTSSRALGRQHLGDVGHRLRPALGADHAHAERGGDAAPPPGRSRRGRGCRASCRSAAAATVWTHLRVLLVLDRDRVGLGDVEQRADDVLRHRSRCVPRAQVSVSRPAGRAARASLPRRPSSPAPSAASACVGSRPGGTPPAISASVRASWSAEGLSLRGSVSTATRSARPAALIGVEIGGGVVGPEQDMGAVGHVE